MSVETSGINFCLCFYWKNTIQTFLNKKIIWLKFLFNNFAKRNQTYLLINNGPSCVFEKFNPKLTINGYQNGYQNICKFPKTSKLRNLHRKSQKFVKFYAYKSFFPNGNREGVYLIRVLLENRKA